MRYTRPLWLCLAVLLILAAGTTRAEEIVYFTNGSAMPVRAHEVQGTMIHVDLGGDAFMAFPLSMVDRVEIAGKEIVLDPSFSGGNMRSSTNSNSGSFPVRGRVPTRHSDSPNKLPLQVAEEDPQVNYDGKMGVAVYQPNWNSNQKGKRLSGATASRRAMGHKDMLGARRVGGRHVIGSLTPPNAGASELRLRGAEPKNLPKPPPSTAQDGADSGSGD
jgi:hypothetical protein